MLARRSSNDRNVLRQCDKNRCLGFPLSFENSSSPPRSWSKHPSLSLKVIYAADSVSSQTVVEGASEAYASVFDAPSATGNIPQQTFIYWRWTRMENARSWLDSDSWLFLTEIVGWGSFEGEKTRRPRLVLFEAQLSWHREDQTLENRKPSFWQSCTGNCCWRKVGQIMPEESVMPLALSFGTIQQNYFWTTDGHVHHVPNSQLFVQPQPHPPSTTLHSDRIFLTLCGWTGGFYFQSSFTWFSKQWRLDNGGVQAFKYSPRSPKHASMPRKHGRHGSAVGLPLTGQLESCYFRDA